MAKSSKELSVAEWEEEIDRALRFRRTFGVEDSWAENEELFYSVHHSSGIGGPNLYASTGDAMISQLSVPTPYITAKPRRMQYVDTAPMVETVDNHLVNDLRLRSRIEQASTHAFLFGVGILKIGYDSMWGWDGDLHLGFLGNDGASLTQLDRKGNQIEFGQARPGMPWVDNVLPHDFVVPWGTKDLQSAPWCAHRTVRHIDDLKADPKYQNTKTLQPSMSMEDWVKSYSSIVKPYRIGDSIGNRTGEGDVEYVELWEIHDVRTHKVLVIATGHDKFLREDEDALQVEGLPFVDVCFVLRTRNFWVTPDARYLKPTQLERTDIALQNQKQRRASVAKTAVAEDALDEDEIVKLTSATVGTIVKIKAGHTPAESFFNLPPYSNQNLWVEGDRVERDAQKTVGFGSNQMGEFDSSSRRTATEAAVVNQNAGLRMGRRQAAIKDAFIYTIQKINGVIFKFWAMPQEIEILGADGAMQWRRFTGDGIKGEYKIDIGFSDDGGESRKGRQQMAMMGLQAIGQPFIDPAGAVKYANIAFNDPDVTMIFNKAFLAGGNNAQAQATMPGLPAPQPQGGAPIIPPQMGQGGVQPLAPGEPHIGARGGAIAEQANV